MSLKHLLCLQKGLVLDIKYNWFIPGIKNAINLSVRFVEHSNDLNLAKTVARHLSFSGHSFLNMHIIGLSKFSGFNETRKRKEQELTLVRPTYLL